MALTLKIVTPGRIVFSNEVDSVVMPTASGEVGILSGHIPLLSVLVPGEVVISRSGQKEGIAVDKGFIRVLGDCVSILTEAAIKVEAIDLSKVAEAEERAKKALEEARTQKSKAIDPVEIEKLEAITRFALVQRLAKNRKL